MVFLKISSTSRDCLRGWFRNHPPKGSLRGIPQGLDEDIVYVQITFRKYDIRILADFRKDIEWNKGDPVGDGGASIFRKSTNGFV